MAAKGRTRLRADQRREVILAAAGPLFAERGYAATTLDQIAAAAGVTKPVLYRHFDSKKALYLALLWKHREDLPRFLSRIPPGLPFEESIEPVLEAWIAYVDEHAYAWRMLFRDSGGDAEIRAARHEVHTRAREVLTGFLGAQKEAGIHDAELEPLAEFIRAGGAGLALWWLDHPDVPREVLVGVTVRMMRGILLSDPGSADRS